jgi:hypothetical protein
LIMDCYPDGLIVADAVRWDNHVVQVDTAVIGLIQARAEEVGLRAAGMYAYSWRQPDDARRAEACARLPAAMRDHALGRDHAQ